MVCHCRRAGPLACPESNRRARPESNRRAGHCQADYVSRSNLTRKVIPSEARNLADCLGSASQRPSGSDCHPFAESILSEAEGLRASACLVARNYNVVPPTERTDGAETTRRLIVLRMVGQAELNLILPHRGAEVNASRGSAVALNGRWRRRKRAHAALKGRRRLGAASDGGRPVAAWGNR